MYKIKNVDTNALNSHLSLFEEKARLLMIGFRDGTLEFNGHLGTKQFVNIIYKVETKSPTWAFLNKYSHSSELKKLLCGSWNELLGIIDDVNSMFGETEWKNKLTKEKYNKKQYQAIHILDNFVW